MKSFLFATLASICLALTLNANTDERVWELTSGEKVRAELESYDAESDEVVLLVDDTERLVLSFNDFSPIDGAWLIEWSELGAELDALSTKLGGEVEHLVVEGQFQTDLYVYYPSSYKKVKKRTVPLMILFNAGGKGYRYLYQHLEAAEAAGMMVISCGQFRNTGDDDEKEAAFVKRFKEVWPVIQKEFKYDADKVFMGGNSGGAWRAFHYCAWIEYKWAGIYSNGGWLGGPKYHELDYCKGMRVAMVNGNNDHANRVNEKVTEILHSHDAKVALMSFEGGHQIPPTRSQIKAFKWLTEFEEFDEK